MGDELKNEAIKNYKKGLKKLPMMAWIAVPCVIVIIAFVFSLCFFIGAKESADQTGGTMGKQVGRVLGSIEGYAKGKKAGYEDGKNEGLSAKDTTAEISTKLRSVQYLDVMVASGTYADVLKIGDDYAAQLGQKYNAVYQVDLNTAELIDKDGELLIKLDDPKVEFRPVGEIQIEREYQKKGFIAKTGNAKDGYIATDNSIKEIQKKAQESFEKDSALMDAAKASAKTQIAQLVSSITISKPIQVKVTFRGDAENE